MTRGKGGSALGSAAGQAQGLPCLGGLSREVAEPVPAEPWLQSCVCQAVAVQRRGERRAGAVPRNPTVTRKARLSTPARMGMPIRLKDSNAVEVLHLVLGPATQRSVVLCRPAPARQHLRPQLPWALPVPFSRSEAKSCKPEGKTSHRAGTSAKTQLAGGQRL